jgi:hypothetical protein
MPSISELARQQEIDRINRSVSGASFRDPDRVAENFRLSESTQLPYSAVEEDPNEAKRIERLQKIEVHNLPTRSPKTAAWLSDERNSSVAMDDIEVLEALEAQSNIHQNRAGYWENQARGIADTMSKIGTEGVGGAAWLSEEISKPFTRAYDETVRLLTGEDGGLESYMQFSEEGMRNWLDVREKSSEAYYGYDNRGDIKKVIASPTPGNIAEFIAEAGPSQIPYMIAAGISYPLIVSVVGNMVAEERVDNDKRTGLPTDQDMYIGAVTSGITGLLERWSIDKLLRSGAVPTVSGGLLPYVAKELPKAALKEGSTEFVQEGIEAVGGSIGTETGVQPMSVFEQALSGALIGTGIGTAVRSATVYPEYRSNIFKASVKQAFNSMESSEQQDWLDQTITLAQSSKANTRSPEQFRQFLESLDPETHVFLDSDIAATLTDAPEYVTEQLDGSGAAVSIPLDRFINDFALDEELLNQVRPHIKLREDLQTTTELEQQPNSDSVKRMVERAEKHRDVMTEAETVYEDITRQLKATGRQGEHTARLSAQIYPAVAVAKHFELKARGIDRSITEIYGDMGLTILGPRTPVPETPGSRSVLDQFSEDNRLTNLDKTGAMWAAIRKENPDLVEGDEVKIYRATIGNEIRPNDFVAANRKVAEDHLANLVDRGEKGTILEMTVAPRDLLMGNDATEFVYSPQVELNDPTTLAQTQDFGDLEITDQATDAGGNVHEIKAKAQTSWDNVQSRMEALEQLRNCVNG